MNRRLTEGLGPTFVGLLLMGFLVVPNANRSSEHLWLLACLATSGSFLLLVGVRALWLPNDRKQLFRKRTWVLISFVYLLAAFVTLVTFGFFPALFPLAASVIAFMWAIGLMQFILSLKLFDDGIDGDI